MFCERLGEYKDGLGPKEEKKVKKKKTTIKPWEVLATEDEFIKLEKKKNSKNNKTSQKNSKSIVVTFLKKKYTSNIPIQ